jgi:hypothetical protein
MAHPANRSIQQAIATGQQARMLQCRMGLAFSISQAENAVLTLPRMGKTDGKRFVIGSDHDDHNSAAGGGR